MSFSTDADGSFLARIESSGNTRTFVDHNMQICWHSNDEISVFSSTINTKYVFQGNDGATSALFNKISTSEYFSAGFERSNNVAIYPFDSTNRVINDTIVACRMPRVQLFSKNSFARNCNSMIAATESISDKNLVFKNICGFLRLYLYGDNTSISSIQISGNNDESLSGIAHIISKFDKIPVIDSYEESSNSIILDCGRGVEISSDSNSPTCFWFVIPPVEFSNGITITITDTEGRRMVKTTENSFIIRRNVVNSFSPIKAECLLPADCVFFDDKNFKSFCINNFDFDSDGKISFEEAEKITAINCAGQEITSLTGINKFKNLKSLNCRSNPGLKSVYLVKGINDFVHDDFLEIKYKSFSKPLISIIDDDFIAPYIDTLKMICDSLGIKCDFALVPTRFTISRGGELDFSDSALKRIPEYINQGYSFLLHPEHNCWYNSSSNTHFINVEHVETSLLETIALFEKYSLFESSKCLVYPGGSDFPGVRSMCGKYVNYGVGLEENGYYNSDLSRPMHLNRLCVKFSDSGRSLTETKIKLADAVEKGSWVILCLHAWLYESRGSVDETTNSWENIIELLKYAKSLAEIKPFFDVINYLENE